MPVGSFYTPTRNPDDRESRGAASQPNTLSGPQGWDPQFQGAWPTGGGASTPAGSGSSGPGSSSPAPGYGQFPMGQGPSSTMPGSIAQYPVSQYGTTAAMLGGSGLGSINSLVSTLFGPQQIALQNQLARQQDQLGLIGVDAQHQEDILRRDNQIALQLLGLDREGLGLDRGLIGTQMSNLDRLRAILAQQRGLVGEKRDLDTEQAKDMAGRNIWDLRSDLTQRGAFNTVANERGTGRINRDLDYALRGIDQTYRNSILGLDEKGISYDNQQAQLQNRLDHIGLDYRRLDISQDQLQNALADGLYNIGMSSMVNINGLLDAMDSTNAAQSQLATQIMQAVISYSGLPTSTINQILAQMGVGGGGTNNRDNSTGSSGSQRTGGNYGS